MNNFLDMILGGDVASSATRPETTLLVVALSFAVGHVIGWIYMWTHLGLSYSRMFVASLVVMPVIVALVMVLMSGNIVIAFGLLAVFAVVRFRNVLKDTRDTVFVLWAISLGMAVGTMRFGTAALGCLCVSAIFLYLRLTLFGSRHRYDVILSLHWEGDGPVANALRGTVSGRGWPASEARRRAGGTCPAACCCATLPAAGSCWTNCSRSRASPMPRCTRGKTSRRFSAWRSLAESRLRGFSNGAAFGISWCRR